MGSLESLLLECGGWHLWSYILFYMAHLKVKLVIFLHWICLSREISNSYTMGCPPVRGDNPRALASGLSYVHVDKHGITFLYHNFFIPPTSV